MRIINPCGPFGYDVEEGMKVFCIAELFLGVYNFVVAIQFIPWIEKLFIGKYNDEEIGVIFGNIFIFLFTITLIAQSILAVLLYFVGFLRKHLLICWIWISFAMINFIMPWILFIFYECNCYGSDDSNIPPPYTYYLLYLLYLIYGVWVVFNFIKLNQQVVPRTQISEVRL